MQGLRSDFIILDRFGYRLLIEGNCADIIQPDITWMGGITEVTMTPLYETQGSLIRDTGFTYIRDTGFTYTRHRVHLYGSRFLNHVCDYMYSG